MNQETLSLIKLSLIDGIGTIKFKKLIAAFQPIETIWQATIKELRENGLDEKTARNFQTESQKIDLDKILKLIEQEQINVLTLLDKNYPENLKQIYDPHGILYIKGEILPTDKLALAVVGARKISNYGRQAANDLVSELVNNKMTIVSGLAFGVDALAHEIALKSHGRTIAVLGSGVDTKNIYPIANLKLAENIIAGGGAVIAEYPPGTPAVNYNFPYRNRIISGLALGTLVIEAAAKSGALITAFSALEQNREIFAVPGSIYNHGSAGANNLIKSGAKLVNRAGDILEELNLKQIATHLENRQTIADSPLEAKILEFLSNEPTHIDKLIRVAGIDSRTINSTLMLLEIKGKIKNLGGMMFVKS